MFKKSSLLRDFMALCVWSSKRGLCAKPLRQKSPQHFCGAGRGADSTRTKNRLPPETNLPPPPVRQPWFKKRFHFIVGYTFMHTFTDERSLSNASRCLQIICREQLIQIEPAWVLQTFAVVFFFSPISAFIKAPAAALELLALRVSNVCLTF